MTGFCQAPSGAYGTVPGLCVAFFDCITAPLNTRLSTTFSCCAMWHCVVNGGAGVDHRGRDGLPAGAAALQESS